MTERATPTGRAALALIGPMIWAAHFFLLYLAEAVLCAPVVSADGVVRLAGGGLTVAALLWVRAGFTRGALHAFARPLIDLSIVAVVLTAIPLLMIESCRPAGA